jgi:hypothetical protein
MSPKVKLLGTLELRVLLDMDAALVDTVIEVCDDDAGADVS